MAQQFLIKFHDTKAGITSLVATPGGINKFTVPADVNIELVDERTGKAPASVKANRKGKDLVIRIEDDPGLSGSTTEIVLEDYYPQVGCQLAGLDDQGRYLQYTPSDRDEASSIAILVDGDPTTLALSGEPIDMAVFPGACAAPMSMNALAGGVGGATISPVMLGALGLGAAAVAIGASGGGHGGKDVVTDVQKGHVPATPIHAPTSYRDNVGAVQSENSMSPLTDDNTPGLHVGALPSDATGAVLYVDGVVTPSVYDAATGTLTPVAPLADGSHALGYGWSNETGITPPSPTLKLEVDSTAPEMPGKFQVADTDFDGKPNISGTGEPNGLVTITDPTGAKHTTTVDPSGHFELEIDMPSKSTGEWTATVTDAAGNVSPPASLTLADAPVATPVITSAIDNVESVVGPITNHGYTNDSQPTLAGTATPGTLVTVFDGAKVLGSVVADKTGSWTIKPSTSMGEGDHVLTAKSTDPIGNVSKASDPLSFTIDVTSPKAADIGSLYDDVAPITGQIVDGTVTNDTKPTLEGWAEPGTTVWISDKGAVLGSATVDGTGYWSFTPDLANGSHSLSTQVVDKAANASDKTKPINFQVDTLAPTVPTVIDSVKDNQSPNTGSVRRDSTIDDSQPEFSGTAEANATVTLMDGSKEIGKTTADSTGKWIITPDRPLSLGEHHITATATDAAGNTGKPSDPFSFTLFTGGNSTGTAINALVDDFGGDADISRGGLTNDAVPTIKGKAQPGTTVTVYAEDGSVLGTAPVDSLGQWNVTPSSPLTEGQHTLTAVAKDSEGRTSEPSGGFQFTLDSTAPDQAKDLVLKDNVGSVVGPITNGGFTDDATPTYSGTAEAGATVTISDKGVVIGTTTVGKDGTWSFTSPDKLADGKHVFTTVVTDPAGNTSGTPTPAMEFFVDTRKVVVSIDSAFDNEPALTGPLASGAVTNDARPTFSGKALAGGIVTLYDGNVVLGTTTADSVTGQWSFEPLDKMSENSHAVTATVTTAAAGVSERTSSFDLVIDVTAPDVPQITRVDDNAGSKKGLVANGMPTDDETPTLTGIAEKGAIVKIIDDGKLIGTAVADSLGNWTFTPTTPLNPGTHAITTTATDAAGNESKPSKTTLLIDPTAPAAPKIEQVYDNRGSSTGPLTTGATTDDPQPVFSGTAEPNATVILMDGQQVIGKATANGSGNWSITPTVLVNGTHHITAKAVDVAGNEGPSTAVFDLTTLSGSLADAPTITSVIDNVNGKSVDTPIPRDGVTNDATPTVNGTAKPGSTVELLDNTHNKSLGTAVADSVTGQWSIVVKPALEVDGAYDLIVKGKAANGDVLDPTGPYRIVLDLTPPLAAKDLDLTDNVGSVRGSITDGAITDDATPTFTGKGEPGATVTVYDGVEELGKTTVKEDGSWSFTPTTRALNDGRHVLIATITDPAGNVGPSAKSVSFIVDTSNVQTTTPPVAVSIETVTDRVGSVRGPIAMGGGTDDPRPVFSGHATPGGLVTLYDGTKVMGKATADSHTGEWTINPTSSLDPGAHNLTTTVTPVGGSESAPSGPFSLVFDVQAPSIPRLLAVTDYVGAKQGPLASGEPTDDKSPTFSGTAEPGSTITILSDGKVVDTTVTKSDGTWEFTPKSPFDPGTYPITLTATDPVGNTSKPSDPAWSLVVDTSGTKQPDGVTDPLSTKSISVTAITDDTGANKNDFVTNDTTLVFSGTSTAADDSQVDIRVDGVRVGKALVKSGVWSFDNTANVLANGSHAVRADLIDKAGNIAKSSLVQTIVVDLGNPDVPTILSFTGGASSTPIGTATNDPTPTMTGTAEPNSLVTIRNKLPNGTVVDVGTAQADGAGNWTFTPATDLPEGNYAWSAIATDAAGNNSDPTTDRPFAIDLTPPAFTVTGLTDHQTPNPKLIADNGVTNDERPTFYGTADPGSKITVTVKDDQGRVLQTVKDIVADATTGAWSFTPATKLLEGTYSLSAVAADPVGNTTAPSKSHVFTVDVTAPAEPQIKSAIDNVGANKSTLSSNAATDDNRPTLKGTAEPGSTVTILDNDVVIGTATANAKGTAGEGKWTFVFPSTNPSLKLVEGANHLKAVATDAAGNSSKEGPEFFLVVDTSVVTTPTVTGLLDDKPEFIGSITDGMITNDDTPTFKGTSKNEGDIIKVYDKGIYLGQVTAVKDKITGANVWTYTPSPLSESSHAFTATATNQAGAESSQTTAINFTVDVTNPNRYASVSEMSKDTGTSVPSTIHDYTTGIWPNGRAIVGNLTGALSTGDTLSVSVDGGATWLSTVISQDTTNLTYKWFAFDPNSHPVGYSIWARVMDSAGNFNIDKSTKVTVDAFAPAAPTSVTLSGSSLEVGLSKTATGNYAVVVNDSVSIYWDDRRIDHVITAADISAGKVIIDMSIADYVPYTTPSYLGAALVDAAGNVSKYVFSSATGPIYLDTQVINPTVNAAYFGSSSSNQGSSGTITTTFELSDVSYLKVDNNAGINGHSNTGIHGAGNDTLKLTGAGQTLDLAGLSGFNNQGKISGIQYIDLTGTGDNTLRLSVNDVLNLGQASKDSSSRLQVFVRGNTGDEVDLLGLHDNGSNVGQWAEKTSAAPYVIAGYEYDTYTHAVYNVDVMVQHGANIHVMF